MSDPFASLLDTFKNEPRKECVKGDADSNTRSKAQGRPTVMSSLKPMVPSKLGGEDLSYRGLSIEVSEADGRNDLDDVFGFTGPGQRNPQGTVSEQAHQVSGVQDDLDAAFSVFEQIPGLQEGGALSNVEPATVLQSEVVDEVRDMEVARLMSLGYSINRALALHERGLLYEDMVKKSTQKRAAQSLMPSPNGFGEQNTSKNASGSFSSLLDSGRSSDGFFSMASDFLNKGKQIVDQLTNFPEEQDRMSRYRNLEEKDSTTVVGKVYTDTKQEILQPEPVQRETHNEEEVFEVFQKKTEVAQPPLEATVEETLLDFDSHQEFPLDKDHTPLSVQQISDIELSGYNEFKSHASEFFKNGDYISALHSYQKSLNSLPNDHSLRIIAYSNITASQLKLGEYKKIIHDCDTALELFSKDRKVWTNPIPNSDPVRTYKEMWPKLLTRRAEAFEHIENYQEALESYQSLIDYNFFSDKVMAGKRRCQHFLNPQKSKQQNKRSNIQKAAETPIIKTKKEPRSSKTYENVERLKEENKQNEKLESERGQLYDVVFERIEAWKSGKGDNIRHLLSNLSSILTWSDWKQVAPSDLVMPRKVKIAYMKAVARTHPDKIPASLGLEQKMIAENIFSVLSVAWEKFKLENKMN
ncbi:hypothetical protein HG535_0C03310 [Zygotorulaspora mrakii]|uniref:SWA2-like ubiquitin-associated domain-containing protein n=1 Tax=Zygotorulaspora mrakii TaxID=42260 RepID=A0A7H9B029_ZYGMR|nr:uncharacterized protein HG535_0C03310 [Zygotorulaspora mrakii]QLG71978.1 hypothetical protein HG535_0C03310 [Zygotorulaspora mrakii]